MLSYPVSEQGTLTFDLDLDDDHDFDEDCSSHDPTLTKYSLAQMERIVDLYFTKHWKLTSIQHNFNLVKNLKEILR